MPDTQERSFRALSFGFRFRSRVPDAVDAVDRLLEPFAVPADGARDGWPLVEIGRTRSGYAVRVDGTVTQRSDTLRTAVGWVAWKASLEAIETAEDVLVLHAGAVALRGAAVVLPAPPDSGKTTLTAALVREGFRYLSDEAALLDPRTGLVHPFPRALAMDGGSLRAVGATDRHDGGILRHVPVGDLGGRAADGPEPVAAVVFPSYRPGADVAIEPVGRAATVVALAEQAFNAERFGAEGVRLLADVVRGATCWRLTMGDARRAAALVREVVEG
jgi:hypothetical protein